MIPEPRTMIMREVFEMPGPDGQLVRVRRTTTTTVRYEAIGASRSSAEYRDQTATEALALATFIANHQPVTRDQIAEFVRDDLGIEPTDTAVSNLLTRTRRAGLIINTGTRARPRWVPAT